MNKPFEILIRDKQDLKDFKQIIETIIELDVDKVCKVISSSIDADDTSDSFLLNKNVLRIP